MGCSSSNILTSSTISQAISLNQVKPSPEEEAVPKPTRFLENSLVVWFCDETSNKFENEQEELRKLVHGLKTFHNINACIAFISTIEDEKIFLIISGKYQTMERFRYFPQVEKTYLFITSPFKLNDTKHRNLDEQIFDNVDSLYEQLSDDTKLFEMDSIRLTIAPVPAQELSFSSVLTKQEASFLFAQMAKEIIHRLKVDSATKDVFLDFCRTHYVNSIEQISLIDEFAKNYRPNKALSYLTKPCFLSRILNRVLYTHEIDIIYKLSFFIKQLNLQLNRLHEENALEMSNIAIVYRGKTITNDEFEALVKDQCGSLLSFSNFLVTTISRDPTIDFVHHRLAVHPDRMGIVFEIHIDQTKFSEKNPFALLKDVNMNKDEVCFYPSTVFRIESIEQTIIDERIIWFVKLKLTNDDDQQLLRLTTLTRNDEIQTDPFSYLGKLLTDMGEYRRAEQVLLELLKDPLVLSLPRRLVRAHNGLAALYTYKNEHAKALHHYEQVLQTSLTYLPVDHPDLAPIYRTIGNAYLNLNDCTHAIENYEKGMELLRNGAQQAHSEIVTDLHTRIGQVRQSISSYK